MTNTDTDVETYLLSHVHERLASYLEFLRIPSVSALPEYAADVRRCADFVATHMRADGLEHVTIAETSGYPVVYGDWLHSDSGPTVLVYGHYDVQPVDPLDAWRTPPFDPAVEHGRVYARGAADDKGNVHLHLQAAEAVLAARGRFPINVKYLFEGDEESGSEHMNSWLEAHRDLLAADLAVVSDSGFFEGNLPAITASLRGILYAQVDIAGPHIDLHSGMHGGTVRNPANAIATIIGALHRDDGQIEIPGFYDDVVAPTERERTELALLPFHEAAYMAEIGVDALAGEDGWTALERKAIRPTLDVNGLWSGYQGEGAKTIIPASAHAKLSCRLVPNQDPWAIFNILRDRIRALAPTGVKVEVTLINAAWPTMISIDSPAVQAAARCLEAVFGRPPIFIRDGGSIPVAASFERVLGLPVILLGFMNPDCQAHGPNESMSIDNYEGGLRTVIRYWDALGQTIRY